MHFGIDYGAKMAGTTAISFTQNNKLIIISSEKKKDADIFISDLIAKVKPERIFIDAPLSLPLAYYNKGSNFHFRECDKKLSAMSPMFLGGLTARAMSLKDKFSELSFYEAYPKMINKELKLDKHYKTNISSYLFEFKNLLPFSFEKEPKNWHEIDATLAWMIGFRFNNGIAKCEGNKNEGIIYY